MLTNLFILTTVASKHLKRSHFLLLVDGAHNKDTYNVPFDNRWVKIVLLITKSTQS